MSRRSLLNSALGMSLASATSDRAPAVPTRKRLIVDAQVHVWKAESIDWPWIRGLKPQMPEPFTIEKLLPLMDEAGVDRAVIIPPDWPGYRNDYALEAAQRYPSRFAVMGRIPLNPQSAAGFCRHGKSSLGCSASASKDGRQTAAPTGSGRQPRRQGFLSCS